MADAPALPAGAEPQMDPRIAAVQAQAAREVGTPEDLERGEQIANVSHYGSLAVGAGIAAQGGPVGLAVFAAGVGGGKAGAWLSEAIGAPDIVADGLEAIGMHRIGGGGPHPARKGHQVAHSYAFAGFLAAIAVGVAVAALVVATGGLAAPVLIGAALAGGLAGGFVGSALGGALAQMGSRTGPITSGSPDVTIESLPAARMTDVAACGKESSPQPIIEGSETIFVNGLPMARIGHKLLCGAVVDEGAPSVFIDKTTIACAQPAPEIPVWARVAADWLGFLPVGRIAGNLGNRTRSNSSRSVPNNCRTTCIDPVDVATGEFVEWRTDIDVPGVLPLQLRRHYASRREGGAQTSLFGPRWVDSWSVVLTPAAPSPGVVGALPNLEYHDDEGVTLVFETPGEVLDAEHLRASQWHLTGRREAPVLVDRHSGLSRHFAWVAGGARARLVALTDTSGNRIDWTFDEVHDRPTRLSHSDGWHVELAWSGGGLQSVWLQEPDRATVELVRYEHDRFGRLVHSASEVSGRLGYRYDEAHRITGWHDDSATDVTIVYEDHGHVDGGVRVAEIITPGGLHSGRFRYDVPGRLTHVTEVDPSVPGATPHTSVYFHDEDGLVTRVLDPLGHSTLTEWDLHQRVVERTDAIGRRTVFEYDDRGLLLRRVDLKGDPLERETAFSYDGEGRLVGLADGQGEGARWSYDDAGRLVAHAAADGRTTTFDYDARGRLRTEWLLAAGAADAEGGVAAAKVEYHYDLQHRPCGHTATNGARSAWQQDRLGRVDWFTDAGGATTTYDYADPDRPRFDPPRAAGHVNPTVIVAADGGTVRQRFDREGLLVACTDASGATQQWQRGPFDVLLGQTDALGHSTRYTYALDGRVAEIVNAAGQRWRWRYDAAGRLVEQFDFAGRRTAWTHDAAGRVMTRRAPDGVILRYEWDAADRVCTIHAPNTRLAYAYNDADQLVAAEVWQTTASGEWLQSQLTRHYDDQGRLAEEVHRLGVDGTPRRLAFAYDTDGRLAGREGPLGRADYAYDALGLLSELQTVHGTVRIERDAMGRVTSRSSAAPPAGQAAGAPQLPLAPHFRLQQQHDKLGRLVQQRSGPVATNAHALPAPVQRQYHWQHDRLLGVDDARFGTVRWQVDVREQITQAQYHPAHLGQIDDGPGRSSAALAQHPAAPALPLRQEQFGYDVLGNVASQGTSAQALQAQRYAGDTVTENGDAGYTWDACGRLQSRTEQRHGFRPLTWRYEWDAFDRLTTVQTPDGEYWRYVYDALGRRRAKRCLNAPNPRDRAAAAPPRRRLRDAEYLWDGALLAAQWKTYADGTSAGATASAQPEVQEWHHDSGSFAPLALLQRRVFAEGERTRLLHVVTDVSGAPREVLANDGELLWAAQLTTWGSLGACHVKDADRAWAASFAPGSRHAANDPEVDIDLRYANQWEDAESGLFYNLNRWYDPATGQYASQDPLGPIEGGLRTHGYVHNPLTWSDPLGLAACPVRVVNGTKIHGTGQRDKTPGHDQFSEVIANRLAMTGKFEAIYLNRSYSTAAQNGHMPMPSVNANRRADVLAIDRNGRVHAIEMASKTDMRPGQLPNLTSRNRAAISSLPAANQGRILVLNHPYSGSRIHGQLSQFESAIP